MESENVYRFYKDTLCENAIETALKIKEGVLAKKRFQLHKYEVACSDISDDHKCIMLCFERYSFNKSNYVGSTVLIKESDFKIDITVYNSGGSFVSSYDYLYDRVFEVIQNLGFKLKPRPKDDDTSIDPSIKELLSDD